MSRELERFPKIIYKYRDWKNDYHKNILLKNELYTPSINQLNDPFDCLIKFDYSTIQNEGLSDRVVEMYFKEFGDKILEMGYNKFELINNTDPNIKSNLFELKKHYDGIFEENRKKHLGVISFSRIWNNLLMWSHYSNSHTGFCVGFDTQKLINSKYFYNGCNVFYPSEYPQVSPFDNDEIKIINIFYKKSKLWEYEEENRMTKLFGHHSDKDQFNKQKYFYFKDDFITEVILGWKISKEHRDEIKIECKKRNIALYQIEDVPGKFEVTRTKIN